MPIYEFLCEEHGKFEALFPRVVGVEYQPCPACDVPAPRIYSLPVMRPDANWHFGQEVAGHGYLNSKSKIERAHKAAGNIQLGDRGDWEAMKKTAEQGKEANNAKLERQTRRHFEKTI